MKENISLRQRILFRKFDTLVNMSVSDMNNFWNSEDSKDVSRDEKEAIETGGLSGKSITKKIAKMISKAKSYRGQFKKVPDWTPDEWALAGNVVRYIKRVFYNVGEFKDDEGNPTPKALAPKYWGFDALKVHGKLPSKDEIKKEVVDYVKKEREQERKEAEKEKEAKKKLNEEFFSKFLNDM